MLSSAPLRADLPLALWGYAAALGVVLALTPLLGVLGAESALVIGVFLTPAIAAYAAHRASLAHTTGEPSVVAWTLLGSLMLHAVTAALIPALLLALNAFRVRNCAWLSGSLLFILGPVFGSILAAILGATVGAWLPRPRFARWTGGLAVFVFFLWTASTLYRSPAVFAYDLFAGYLPGTLYDRGVEVQAPYITFRGVSVVFAIACTCLYAIRMRVPVRRRMLLIAFFGSSVAFLSALSHGAELGFRSSSQVMADKLGKSLTGTRCVVHLPRERSVRERNRRLQDCEFRVAQMEDAIGVRMHGKLHAFFFRSAEEKKALMGAGQTYIAKPWRREVYLQDRAFPHPVLAHEVAHVVAGELVPGPFHIAGFFRSLWPEPALIEGLAVAVDWSSREDLTPHQWARAMREAKLMPPLDAVFGLSFLAGQKGQSYTAAGSFLRFIIETRGAAALRKLYKTADVEEATGASLAALEKEWHAFLKTVPLPSEARDLAKLRFDRPSLFASVCPHQVAELEEDLHGDLIAGDYRAALRACDQILDIDAGDPWTRYYRAESQIRTGHQTDMEIALKSLEGAPRALAGRLWQVRGDEAWRAGDFALAKRAYDEASKTPQTESARRGLQARQLSLQTTSEERALLFRILVGDHGVALGPAAIVVLASDLDALRNHAADTSGSDSDGSDSDGLGAYLAARQLMATDRKLALDRVDRALEAGLPFASFTREAKRMRGQLLFEVQSFEEAKAQWTAIALDKKSSAADVALARDWLARTAWAKKKH